ncbi:M42 family metallopeptidase [Conexibacter sp. SYSU D00693]|uniref:M42 family metallopeptidase n=1 Tax=Conexibacter sp. SYSU D00693 TaxID=2812560 RepID=UPI00196B60B2|nr:M42 family metallopeptidase [Conexibacter sp. SYSU D00693]
MPLPDALRDLLTATGPSGYETAPSAAFRKHAEALGAEVTVDAMGNTFARLKGTKEDAPTLAVVGHADEIGLVVTHIDDDGFLWFTGVGGWDPQILVGQRVAVTTRDGVVPGVLGRKPIHLLDEDERKRVPKLKDLHIDIGAKDGDEAKGRVRIGDTAVVAAEPLELPNDRVVSRAMDNRLGCFVALEVARLVHERGGSPGDVLAVAAVQEEIGCFGAGAAAYGQEPDVAIVVDVTHETGAPGIDVKQEGKHGFGSGPVLERGSILNPHVFERLHDAAEAEGVTFTVAASGGRTWTDADAIHLVRQGIPTGLVGLPLRYMHSPVEMVDLGDVAGAAKAIAALAMTLEPGTSFAR